MSVAGYRTVHGPWSSREIIRKKATPPAAVVIDLSRSPSHGRDIAVAMRSHKALLKVPFVLAGGAAESVAAIKALLPDALETSWSRLPSVLRRAIANPPGEGARQLSVFAAYEGTPLPKKLGIKPRSVVVLVNAPDGFEQALDPLPQGASLTRNARQARDLTLWFVSREKELTGRIAAIAEFAGGGGLWIIWPKQASSESSAGLTQKSVRCAGLKSGLVDFKIGRVDDNWAGLRFTQRK